MPGSAVPGALGAVSVAWVADSAVPGARGAVPVAWIAELGGWAPAAVPAGARGAVPVAWVAEVGGLAPAAVPAGYGPVAWVAVVLEGLGLSQARMAVRCSTAAVATMGGSGVSNARWVVPTMVGGSCGLVDEVTIAITALSANAFVVLSVI